MATPVSLSANPVPLGTGVDFCGRPGAKDGSRRGPACNLCPTHPESVWASLSQDGLRDLNAAKVHIPLKPGRVLFFEGAPATGIYCVMQGTIGIRRADEAGNPLLVRLVRPGHTVGERSFFEGGTYSASAEALTESEVCFIEREGVRLLMDRNPGLAKAFLHQLAEELRLAEEERVRQATLPVRARMARLLLDLRDHHGAVDDEGVLRIDLPLSRRDMAELLAARPETVARTIHALDADGVAHFAGRKVSVADLDALMDAAEPTSED